MMRRLPEKFTYANVVATIALFVALGGTSYAALKLPRNSVGAAQIRTGAVRSAELKDRTVALRDLSLGARFTLRGQQGPAGAAGPQGPAGPPAARFFAAMSSAGALVRGNATGGGSDGGVGNYTVAFSQSISACVYSATLGTTDATSTVPGRVIVRDNGGRVGVQTFDPAGAPADLPFHLVVTC